MATETKRDMLISIVADAHSSKTCGRYPESKKINDLAAALWVATKGTRYEQDAKDLILISCPEYFEST